MQIEDFDNLETLSQPSELNNVEGSGENNFLEVLDNLTERYENKSCTFSEIETIVKELLATIPKLDYCAIRSEIATYHVETYDNPTTFQLLEGINRVQEYKNRIGEILMTVENEWTLRKRMNEILFDSLQAISKQSSADKRKGEATMRYPLLLIKYETINSLKSDINNVLSNLRSTGDLLSRQASIISMQINLGEYRKKVPAEFNEMLAEAGIDYKSGVEEIKLGE